MAEHEYEIYLPADGPAKRFLDTLSPSERELVERLLLEDIESHPLPEDRQPPHLVKTYLNVAGARNGVLCTDGKYYFYYHFPEAGIISVVAIGYAPPFFLTVFSEE